MSSEYQPTPPELASSMRLKAKVSQYTILVQNLLQTEQLMRRVAIYGSITDSWVASILKHIPEEARDKVVQEQVRIMNKSSQKAIASATAAASKFHLIHRDVALEQLQLQDEHIIRARTAPFHGHSLVGPEPQECDKKIMRDQHALPRGLTSHFKVPKKPAPKPSTQLRPSVHQRPGAPVGQEGSNQSFRNGQQNKSRNSNFSNARIARGPLPRNPSRRTRGGGAKKTAGPSKGARQWRSVGGGLPTCFYPAMAKPARRVQIAKNPAVRCPVVGSSASFDKDTHSSSNQEQETTSTEGRGQPAGEGGHRASSQEPLPGLLQQAVSCSKEDQRSLSCDRPVHAEQTSDSPFADRDGPDSEGCSPSGQMDGIYRRQGCVMKKYINRLVSQMRVPLVACHELEGSYE